jgi:hypothetical protein
MGLDCIWSEHVLDLDGRAQTGPLEKIIKENLINLAALRSVQIQKEEYWSSSHFNLATESIQIEWFSTMHSACIP